MNAVELVNPAFPNLEGRDLLDLTDTHGKYLNRELLEVVRTRGSGWVDYMWPKPGDSVSTQKSAFVSSAKLGESRVMVGCGVYLEDAPRESRAVPALTAAQLMKLVREAAAVLAEQGEQAYLALRQKGSKWFRDDSYFFVFTTEGTRAFHAAEPETEGRGDIGLKDILGRPIVRMIEYAALLLLPMSFSRYSPGSNWMRATPDFIAASATAGATHHSTRGSNGFGMK